MSVWSTPYSTVLMFYICAQALLQHHEQQHKNKIKAKQHFWQHIQRRKKELVSPVQLHFFSGIPPTLIHGPVFYPDSFWQIRFSSSLVYFPPHGLSKHYFPFPIMLRSGNPLCPCLRMPQASHTSACLFLLAPLASLAQRFQTFLPLPRCTYINQQVSSPRFKYLQGWAHQLFTNLSSLPKM